MIDAQSDAPTASQGPRASAHYCTQQQQQPLDAQHTAVLHLDAQHTYYRYMYGTTGTVVALAIDRTAVHDCTQPRTGTSTNYEYEYRYVPTGTVVRTAVLEATVATTTTVALASDHRSSILAVQAAVLVAAQHMAQQQSSVVEAAAAAALAAALPAGRAAVVRAYRTGTCTVYRYENLLYVLLD
jgi:hypothetical protein